MAEEGFGETEKEEEADDEAEPAVTAGDLVKFTYKGKKLRGDQDASGWFKPEVRSKRGRLADIMPTALAMMGLPKPTEMTGISLLAD